MSNTMEHEQHRFSTMNKDQLVTRLYKITDRQKLINFLECSKKLYDIELYLLARKKYEGLFGPLPALFSGISKALGTSGSAGPMGTSGGSYESPIIIPKSNISLSLKEKKKEPKKKAEPSKPVDIADIIYTKRKLRLD